MLPHGGESTDMTDTDTDTDTDTNMQCDRYCIDTHKSADRLLTISKIYPVAKECIS